MGTDHTILADVLQHSLPELKKVFDLIDTDGSGKITIEEFKAIPEDVSFTPPLSGY